MAVSKTFDNPYDAQSNGLKLMGLSYVLLRSTSECIYAKRVRATVATGRAPLCSPPLYDLSAGIVRLLCCQDEARYACSKNQPLWPTLTDHHPQEWSSASTMRRPIQGAAPWRWKRSPVSCVITMYDRSSTVQPLFVLFAGTKQKN